MKIGEKLLNEVPVEKSILVDFDQLITLVNKWKTKWVHEGYSWLKNTKTTPVSAVLPPSDLLFLLEDNCKDPWGSIQWRFQLINGTITGQSTWRSLTIFGCSKSCLGLINSAERTNSEEAERGGGRVSEKREKGAMITLILSLLTLFLICETWQFYQNITLKNYQEN